MKKRGTSQFEEAPTGRERGSQEEPALAKLTEATVITEWMGAAACKGMDTSLFFPETSNSKQAVETKNVCRGCPVREECLNYAILNKEKRGIWGGTSGIDRRKIRGRRKN